MENKEARQFAECFTKDWAKAGTHLEQFMKYFAEEAIVELMVRGAALAEFKGPFNKSQWREQTRRETSASELHVIINHVWSTNDTVIIEVTGNFFIRDQLYDNFYCYILEFDERRKVRHLRIYLDSLYALEVISSV